MKIPKRMALVFALCVVVWFIGWDGKFPVTFMGGNHPGVLLNLPTPTVQPSATPVEQLVKK